MVPLDSFKLVRGPRIIPDGPPLNVSGGIYQLGMTMSKFVFNTTTTELDNFRDGYFDFHIREIGLYKTTPSMQQLSSISTAATTIRTETLAPKIFTKDETKKNRKVPLKILLLVAKIFFSEQR